jgi:hypothetical protein
MKTKNDVHSFFRPAREAGWPVESAVRAIAGLLVLVGLGLSLLDLRWLWLVAFVGVNLLQSGLSGWCLLSNVISAVARKRPA